MNKLQLKKVESPQKPKITTSERLGFFNFCPPEQREFFSFFISFLKVLKIFFFSFSFLVVVFGDSKFC